MKNTTKIKTTKSKATTKVKTAKKAVKKTVKKAVKVAKVKAVKKTVKKAVKVKAVKAVKAVKKTAKKAAKTVKAAKAVKKVKTVKKVKAAKSVKKAVKAVKKTVKAAKSVKKTTKTAKKVARKSTDVKAVKKVVKKTSGPKVKPQVKEALTTQVGDDANSTDDSSDSSDSKDSALSTLDAGKIKHTAPSLSETNESEQSNKKAKGRTKSSKQPKENYIFIANKAEVLEQPADDTSKQAEVAEQARQIEEPVTVNVEIREEGDNTFVFILPGARKVLNLVEMRSVVRICHLATDERVAVDTMYEWFFENRKDIIVDCYIAKTDSIVLHKIFSLIKATYKLKGQ